MPLLVLTTYDSSADILRAIEAGATGYLLMRGILEQIAGGPGYLLKDTPHEQLCAAILAVAQGESVLAPEVTTRILQQMHTPANQPLSQRELVVLAQVARGASNKEIAHHLHVSEATIKSHLFRIFGKLGVSDRTVAVTVAIERGLLRLEP